MSILRSSPYSAAAAMTVPLSGESGTSGTNTAASSAEIGHLCLPCCSQAPMARAARRPAPIARITVTPPVTMSPPAKDADGGAEGGALLRIDLRVLRRRIQAELLALVLAEQADRVGAALDGAAASGDYVSSSEVIREALRDWRAKRLLAHLWDEGIGSGSAHPDETIDDIKKTARRRG